MAELLDRYRNLITIGLAALVAAAVVAFVLDQRDSAQPLTINLADPTASGPIEVYIPGAVTEPGVYAMSDGDRIIDLLYEGPDGYVVVDYKTDALPGDGAIDDAMQRYRPQGAAYALALSEALGRPATRCVFLFLTPTGPVEREIADLEAAVLDVRGRVLSLPGGPPETAGDL